jgi:hypothetical protein
VWSFLGFSLKIAGIKRKVLSMLDVKQTRSNTSNHGTSTLLVSDKSKAWLTGMLDKMMTHLDESSGTIRHSEPEKLIVSLEDSFSAKRWDEDTIHHLMLQLPKLKQVHFMGHGNPFLVLNNFPKLLKIFHEHYGVECHVEIAPSTLSLNSQEILDSPIASLSISMESHSPSDFHMLTGQAASLFLQYQDALYRFLTKRLHHIHSQKQTNGLEASLQVWVQFNVNQFNYKLIPNMLRTAEQWGVQGVHLVNHASLEELPFVDEEAVKTFKMPLYQEDAETVRFIKRIKPEDYRVAFELPTLLQLQDNKLANRYCDAAYSTVSMDTAFNTSPCPKWALLEAGSRKIWQGDFWNAPHFQYVRAVHHHATMAGRASASAQQIPVPDACVNCSMNCSPAQKQATHNTHLL